jgi:hypothetical protein
MVFRLETPAAYTIGEAVTDEGLGIGDAVGFSGGTGGF